MACIVYRKGTGAIVRGIKCEYMMVDVEFLHATLNSGWYASPEEIDGAPVEEEKSKSQESSTETEEETQKSEKAKLTLEELRKEAKNKGIEGYASKRTNTLRRELGYDSGEED